MFKLQRLEISGFKSFADYTEIVFTGSGITAVVGPNGCGKSNVSDAISWVLGEQRAKSLRGGEMKDVVFAGTKSRKPGGMAEVVLHLVRDDSAGYVEESDLDDIDNALSGIDELAVDMDAVEGIEPETEIIEAIGEDERDRQVSNEETEVETVKAAQVGSIQVVESRVKTKRHWRPRSFALDFAPGEAVSVTRRLYLSGESEYQLNGKTCRLRDISDLFAGTGLSGSHYAIIEQGRIGQILSAKPADRRNLIEEAAGISKFRTRQRAAESRLDTARSNLNRITDIVSEVETRVNSLRRQAAKTRRFKILQEEFRQLLRQLYAAEGRHLTSLSAQLETELASASGIEADMLTKVAATEGFARDATQTARNAEDSLAELRRIHADNALERDRAEREHVYKSEQVVALNSRIETLRNEIVASNDRLSTLRYELERLQKDEAMQAAELAAAEDELHRAEQVHSRELESLNSIESAMESSRAELIQHTAAAERFAEIGRQLELNLTKVTQRADGLEAEAERATQTCEKHEKQVVEMSETLAADEAKLAQLNIEKDQLLSSTAIVRDELRLAESALQALIEDHSAKHHRLATLNELEEKRAVYTPQVQRLFAEQAAIGVSFSGVLADRLNVDEAAETAVEALFGGFLEAVVVDSLADAKRVSDWLNLNNAGRTPILISASKKNGKARSAGADRSIESVLGVDPEFAATLRDVFPREMAAALVNDLRDAPAGADTIAVNYEGDVLIGGRLLIGGGMRAEGANESLLAFKRELSGLSGAVSTLAAAIETDRKMVEAARQRLVELESKTVDLQSLIIKVDRGIHGLQIQLRTEREEIERSLRHKRVVSDEKDQAAAEIIDIKDRMADADQNKAAAENARREADAALGSIALTLADARQTLDAANLILNEKRTTAATSGERRRSAQSALRRVENEIKDVEARLAIQELELQEASGKIRSLHLSIDEITDRIAAAPDSIANENAELKAAIDVLAAARAAADKASEELAALNHASSDALNARAEIEVRQAEAVTELKNAAENCMQELGVPLDELVSTTEIDPELILENARSAAHDLRERLDGFGAINMLALDELGEAEERHLFLTTQRADIVDSIAATEEALREIKERSRERFRQAFEAINANFAEFFQELFGGGQGQMTLLESEDILEAGIEVVAQPPGKRLQNILLLSGGEKAMTAIALVMSIFKYRPSPFCLLDEVDAPLDDANVGRFVNKIADMAEKTQFIVITHNKRTMEAARALYGVTMQEPGVSKVVSVKFE